MKPETWLDIHAAHAADRPALLCDGKSFDYGQLRNEAREVASGLSRAGVKAGDRVGVALAAGCDYALLVHALLILGATLCPLDPRDPSERGGLDHLFAGDDPIPRADAAGFSPGAAVGSAPVCEVRSSGSTGTPKSVPLSATNIFWSAIGSANTLGVEASDRWLICLPLFHVSGLMPLYRSLIYGTAVTLHDGFVADSVQHDLSTGEISGISLVPTALSDLLESSPDALSTPRTVLVGGAACPRSLIEEALERRVSIALTYGMTEAASQVSVLPPEEVPSAIGSVGRPLVTCQVRIEEGEIQICGATVSVDSLDEDGWYRTGDRGRIDDEGRLWVEGRLDEMILSGGENVFPSEVEAVLLLHPAVTEALVFPVDDPRWQERVEAAYVPAPGSDPSAEELFAHCREYLTPAKVPKRIHEVEEIPFGATGKPDRRELAERFSADPR